MSTLNVSNISDGTTTVGTSYVVNGSAKAWVNFNGTGTVAVRDSMNVASITDNGNGIYTANFSQNMASMNYSASITTGQSNDMNITNRACCVSATTASSVSASVYTASGGARIDMDSNSFTIQGDLA